MILPDLGVFLLLYGCLSIGISQSSNRAACKEPLGMQSGKIEDDQITAFSAYSNDFNTYGAHRARLNLTTWPPGHRADPQQALNSWLKIELKEKMVITGIATRGYGDPKAGEWVTKYMLLYSTGDDYLFFKDQNGGLMMFSGNKNWYSVVRNEVPIPTVVQSIMLMPSDLNNNFALRMELYGCKPGYYFIVSLKIRGSYFHTDYLEKKTSLYTTTKEDTILEVGYVLESVPGYLHANLHRFWPDRSEFGEVQLVADVRIDCIEAAVHYITTTLKSAISQTEEGLFDPNYIKVQYPLDFKCRPPLVQINVNSTMENAPLLYTTDTLRLKGHVKLMCNITKSTLILWDRSIVNSETNQLVNPMTMTRGKLELSKNLKTWKVGLHFIRLSVTMRGQEGTMNFDFGFVNITLPPLVALIKGPVDVQKGSGPFYLDGSKSYDPSFTSTSMKYTWLCRRTDETFDNVNMSNPIDVISSGTRDKGGCFGYGPGRMNSTEPILKVPLPTMDSKLEYVFQVIVKSDFRESKIDHKVLVNSSVMYSIRCTMNCGAKVTTSKRTTFTSSCIGKLCKSIDKYNWKLYNKDPFDPFSDWMEVKDLVNRTLTELDNPLLAIIGMLDQWTDALGEETEYKITSMVTLKDGSTEEANEIEFFTNGKPYLEGGGFMDDEGCFVTPEIGTAVTTEFLVWCNGYVDDDLPLQYEFRYVTSTGMVVIDKTYSNNITTRLPLGDAGTDFTIVIEIFIYDSLGASVMDFWETTVKPMAAKNVGNTLKTMTSGKNSAMGNLLKSGNVAKAAQMAYAVLSLVNKGDETIGSNDRKSLKEGIINQITKVKVQSLEQVTQVAAVVALATGEKDEISQESQANAINLLANTANFLATQKGDNPELMQKVGASLLYGIGNLMSATASQAQVTDDKSKPDEDKEAKQAKSKEMAKKTLNMMDSIGGSLLSTKLVGEKPSVFKTKDIALLLDRQMPSKMGNKKLGEGNSEVALPSAGTLFGDSSGDMPAVDSQMVAFNDNPFTWDESSKNVKSSVVEFTLKAPGGKELQVKGLKKPIELYIPQKVEEKPKSENDSSDYYFAKPSVGKTNMRSHQITIKSEEVAVSIVIRPEDGASLEVYVRHAKKPTPKEYNIKRIIPDYTSCNHFDGANYTNCTDDPYTLTLSSAITGGTGVHYIGVRYIGISNLSPTDPASVQEQFARVRRDCYSHNGRMKRNCVGVKDPPTTVAPTPFIIIPQYNATTDVNYTMSVSVTSCLYWSKKLSKWTSEGCKVGPKSVASKLHCLCTHLSAFGGDFFVAPNPIDFDKVFAAFGNLAESGNFVVLSVACGLFGLYFLGLVFARKADKKDETKVVANVYLAEEDLQEGYLYQISINTGMWRGYGTTASVGIILFGEEGKTDEIMLTDKNLNKNFFARGSVNNFTVTLPHSLGDLTKIKIWHDNSGDNPAWFFHQVLIVDVQTAEQTYFLGNRWLAVEKGDGQIDIEIPKAEKKDLSGFRNLFYSRTAKSLGEGHIWLSVFTRPPHNTFTRCQRLSCCMSILFASMVTNAMFYQFGGDPKDTFQIGPLKMSWTQIKIGIQSSIVAIPVNILIVTIFRNIKYSTPDDGSEEGGQKKKTPGCLPHFFVYFAWILSSLTSLAAATFTVFYSLMWGASTSNQWLTSIMVSFFQDVIITQPIKVVMIASLLSLVLKKPPAADVVQGESLSKEKKDGEEDSCMAPRGAELERQRIYRTKVIAMFRTLVEIIFFVIFIMLVVVVCYGNRKVTRYQLTDGMEKLCKGFEKVTTNEKFWNWVKSKLLPSLYDTKWYNNEAFEYEEGYISNREAFIVGMPRLRQLRKRSGPSCIVEKIQQQLAHMFARCLPPYSQYSEFTQEYSLPGWKPVHNLTKSMSLFELRKMCPKPWRYRTAESLNSRPFQGKDITYGGGGFVADLGYNSWQAIDVVKKLERNDWLDDKTAAVMVEFTVFEPSSSLFSHSKYVFERMRTGLTHARQTVKTLVLYSSSDQNFQAFFQVCQLMLMLMILFFLFVEIGKIYRERLGYVKQFWNWMELVQITSAVAAIVMFFFKESYTSDFVKKVQDNPYETSSIDYIIMWSDLEIYLLSLVIFVVTLKFLRLIRFNRSICQMTGTLVRAAKSMASFFILFIAVVLAFTQLGFLAFGATITAYSSFFQSLRAVLQMLLGGEMHFYELQDVDGFIGPAFTFVYMMSMTMILLNMFLAILNDSYEETKEEECEEDFADADLCEFMTAYFSESIHVFANELKNLGKKLVSIAQRHIENTKKKPMKDEDYVKLPIEDPQDTVVVVVVPEEDKVDLNEKCDLASLESFGDLFDDDDDGSLDDVKSSMTELRRSVLSLKAPEPEFLLSLPEDNVYQIMNSPKWDSPRIEVKDEIPSKPGSIFDRPTSQKTSLFDRPTGPSTFMDIPKLGYFGARYSPYSSTRFLNLSNKKENFMSNTTEDEKDLITDKSIERDPSSDDVTTIPVLEATERESLLC